jgi:hypothetical protein
MANEKPDTITLNIGAPGLDFQSGNFLNAVDELCCTMEATRRISAAEMADALELYVKRLRSEG